MRTRICWVMIFIGLVFAVSTDAKAKIKPKAKSVATKSIDVSGCVVKDSCSATSDTAADRVLLFSVRAESGEVYSCRIDRNHPANAEWGYLKGILASKQVCFTAEPDETDRTLLLITNNKGCH